MKKILDLQCSYDLVTDEYVQRFYHELDHKPFDRDLLDHFAGLVGKGPVCDLGCGPGHVARYLHDRQVDAFGLDLSPAMVTAAKRLNSDLTYVQGDMASLDAKDEAWAGIVAFYCLIHIHHDSMVAVLNELKRVLQSDGLLMLSFHIGDENLHLDELWDITVNMDFFFFTLDEMQRFLQTAGFEIEYARDRPPYEDVEYPSQRGYILARKPVTQPEVG
ncbi:class I SAM-dependent DNA methyltransferase [Candidatus Neomarinimicrobiota bacterium]